MFFQCKPLWGDILLAQSTESWGTNLIEAVLDAAELSGVRLWEAQISGWSIKDVVCTEAYWDREGTEATFYEVGEFERQHGDAERIELIYRDGISRVDVNTLPLLVQHLWQ